MYCKCEERKKELSERNWQVITRNGNYSAFNGYAFQRSDYSCVVCKKCGATWRTKAAYVSQLKDVPSRGEKIESPAI